MNLIMVVALAVAIVMVAWRLAEHPPIRAWLVSLRATFGLSAPSERCDVCDQPVRKPVKVVDLLDGTDLEGPMFGGGTAMVATFCETHAPKEPAHEPST